MKTFYPSYKYISFRKWSRKRYAVFASLNKVIKICTLLLVYTLITGKTKVAAQTDTIHFSDTLDLEEVEIEGRSGPDVYSAVSRIVTVIEKAEIESAPVQSLNEILEYALNVDIRQRGVFGVQSDISLRGGTFDQVLILLNGMNITDPQTGHLNLDLPVDVDHIEKIEVLNGPAARIYGSNALSGAVNIITQTADSDQIHANFTAGEYGFIKSGLSAGLHTKNTGTFLGYSTVSSDGYAHNTDFLIHNLFYNGSFKAGDGKFEVMAGYNRKKFGANAFYSPRYPDQFEEGNVFFAGLKYTSGEKIKFTPHLYWRRKSDHYVLIRDNPSVYQNFHRTDMSGLSLNWTFRSIAGKTSFGAGVRNEDIMSNNIGLPSRKPVPVKGEDSLFYDKKYLRSNIDLFLEHAFFYKNLFLSAGAMLNRNSDYPRQSGIYPGFDISYTFFGKYKIFGSLNRAVHFPTFTDLFYIDPNNQGNLDLEPNTIFTREIGFKMNSSDLRVQAAYFYNSGQNIIDWLWNASVKKFAPVNIPRFESKGVELAVKIDFNGKLKNNFLEHFSCGYSYTDVDKSISDSLSKYYNLKHQINISFQNQLFRNLKASWSISWQERTGDYIIFDAENNLFKAVGFEPYWLMDGRIFYTRKFLVVYVEASNLLDTQYVDSGSLTQPGRWLRAGIKISL